jgi:hypothetical protein
VSGRRRRRHDGGADGATGGELPDCEIADEPECNAATGCTWSTQIELCVIDCAPLDDMATCESAEFCEWAGDACEHHAI